MPGKPDLTARFDQAMNRLGPFERHPRLAAAVSGGADSMALAWLAREWAMGRGGTILALIVDHGLRDDSAAEAKLTQNRLIACGVDARILTLSNLTKGPSLAARARAARYDILVHACAAAAIPHLLLGHHQNDQVETVMLRALSSSATRGLAGMAALAETALVRLLRPLLDTAPGEIREFLAARGITWVEDPSNRDPIASRNRLRNVRADPTGTDPGTVSVAQAAGMAGIHREMRDQAIARTLANRAAIHPEGFAILTPGAIEPESLAALLRMIAGQAHAPPADRVAALARNLGPATLGGVRILPAGRLGPGWLLVRERRAMAPPIPVRPGAIWDGRFRLAGGPSNDLTGSLTLGALAGDAARFRGRDGLPSAVLHGLPALRRGENLIAVPHIGVGDPVWRLIFAPPIPASGAPFLPGAPSGLSFPM